MFHKELLVTFIRYTFSSDTLIAFRGSIKNVYWLHPVDIDMFFHWASRGYGQTIYLKNTL